MATMKNKFDVKTKDQFIALKKEILDNIKEIKKREKLFYKKVSIKKLKDIQSKKLVSAEEKRIKKEYDTIVKDYLKANKYAGDLIVKATKNSIEVDIKFTKDILKLGFMLLDKIRLG